MSNWYYYNGAFVPENELYHYGVKGMRWGHRKRYYNSDGSLNRLGQARQNMQSARQNARAANKDYSKSFNKASNYSSLHPITQWGKGKNGQKADQLWKDAYNKADSANAADKAYKNAKKDYKAEKKAAANTPEAKAARKKAMIKAGVAIAGTALAAYGTYKVAKYMQDKRNQAAMGKAQDYINKNFMEMVGQSKFKDGSVDMTFRNAHITGHVASYKRKGAGKEVGKHNAKVIATARKMYNDATNTKLDRGLAKVVNTGDAVGNAAKRAATNVKTTAKKATNRVLDVVNPLYDYQPVTTTTTGTDPYGYGFKVTKSVTNYNKVRRRRG